MLIFRRGNTESGSASLVLIFGHGLIGSALSRRLQQVGYSRCCHVPSYWLDTRRRRQHFQEALARTLEIDPQHKAQMHLVWSAGSGSFACTWAELAVEHESFRETLKFFGDLRSWNSPVFHFISSAGGLFEGQVQVDRYSRPLPRRPYGEMKLQQEEWLISEVTGSQGRARVYRPSTVYGAHRYQQRAGLISHLMWGALYNVPVTLERNMHAMRDYVYVADVADFMVQEVENCSEIARQVHYLVSAKPSTIFEVKTLMERLLHRPISSRYTGKAGNDADITFVRACRPTGWGYTPIQQGLGLVLQDTLSSFRWENPRFASEP